MTFNNTFVMSSFTAMLLVTPCVSGCGGDGRVAISGSVTLDGKPVEKGSISFQPEDGIGPGTGAEIKGGCYEITGAAAATPGRKKVSITAVRKTGKQIAAGMPFPSGTMIDEEVTVPPRGMRLAPTYPAEVTAGKKNELDFKLTSK